MSTEHLRFYTAHLYRYSIASADMYYSEVGMRDVFISTDERGNFQIWGQVVGEDASTAINLCEIFLEYAMYCCTWCNADEAFCHMEDFARQIGRSVSEFLKKDLWLSKTDNPIESLLEHVFQTMNARMSIEYLGATEHFVVIDCPLEDTAEHSGLWNIELAHHGINVMCQSMIRAFNPEVVLATAPQTHPEFTFTILNPEFA